MALKTILITEPENPVLLNLAIQFLQRPDLRVVRFDRSKSEEYRFQVLTAERGELQFGDCEDATVDEIWHTANPVDSAEQCRKTTDRVLLLADKEDLVVHYLSVSSVAVLRRGPSTTPLCSADEQNHLLNEEVLERSGCKFRIYRLPFVVHTFFQTISLWEEFACRLSRFKDEMEDRLPGYFITHPLRLCWPHGSAVDVARVEDIVPLLGEILSSGKEGPYFHVRTQRPLPVKESLQVLAEWASVRLQIVTNVEQQNYVDRLFALRMGELLAHLERTAQAATEVKQEQLSTGQAWLTIPSASLQDLVGKPAGAAEEVAAWKSFFKQKQVVLPDGVVLNYYDGGEGEKTLVLLNAYGQSFGYWERFFRETYARFRIILWLPRGNDGDIIGLRVASPQALHAEDLEQVLIQEGVEDCTLLAWCSGPKLALEYYSCHPHRVSSMLFVAGSFKGLRENKPLETEYEKNLESLLEAIEKYPETAGVVLEYLKGTLLAQGKQPRSVEGLAAISDRDLQQALSGVSVSLQELVLHPLYAANVVAYAKQMRDFWAHDFVTALNKVAVPVLFVGGDCDRIASQAIAKLVAGMIPKAKYLEVKGGTHYIHYDQWDLLAQAAEQLVNSGCKLEFSAPGTELIEFDQEFMTARRS